MKLGGYRYGVRRGNVPANAHPQLLQCASHNSGSTIYGNTRNSSRRRFERLRRDRQPARFNPEPRSSMERSDRETLCRNTRAITTPPESLFECCGWFYALCREYLFHDHTEEIAQSLFPSGEPSLGTHILELGCGPGFYACRLSQQYPQIRATGIDLSRRLLARAKTRAASRSLRNCTFLHGDAHSLPNPSQSFDAVIVSRLFLVVPGREAIIGEIFRVLRPGGRCFIAEPASGLRARIPLTCMWLLSKLGGGDGRFREPRHAGILSAPDFAALVCSQPWANIDLQYSGTYQCAICRKSTCSAQCRGHGHVLTAEGMQIPAGSVA